MNDLKQKLSNFIDKPINGLKYNYFELVISIVILINAIVIFLQVGKYNIAYLNVIDQACTIIFIIEMFLKIFAFGNKKYWYDGWNRMDGILVILSVPSLIVPFIPACNNLSILLILRLLRFLKFFKIMKFFPKFGIIVKNFRKALTQSMGVLLSFVVIMLIFAVINCSLFGEAAPEYFGTPAASFYSIFKLFTIEGWYEMPEAITNGLQMNCGGLIKCYFGILLVLGGIIGVSLINSIFVDVMVEDNNDDIKIQLVSLEEKIDKLLEQKL